MNQHDISIAIETEENKVYYVRWSEMEDDKKQAFKQLLKTESYKEIGDLIKNIPKSHFYDRKPTASRSIFEPPTMTEPPQHVEQSSLGITGYDVDDEDTEKSVNDIYEKARNGDEKAIRMIAAWSTQGDKRAKTFLIQLSKTPEQLRKRVIIP